MPRRRKVCMSVAQFERLIKKKSCGTSSRRKHKRRGKKHRMPPRTKSGKFRKRRHKR